MARHRASFLAGFATGFTAGARAGTETYDQITKYARTAWEHPTVQQARGQAQTQAQNIGGQLASRVPQVAQSLGSHIPGMRSRDAETAQETETAGQETETTGPWQYASTGGVSRPDIGSGFPGS
jgi:hypothetical protein